jgi:hypothetical protein
MQSLRGHAALKHRIKARAHTDGGGRRGRGALFPSIVLGRGRGGPRTDVVELVVGAAVARDEGEAACLARVARLAKRGDFRSHLVTTQMCMHAYMYERMCVYARLARIVHLAHTLHTLRAEAAALIV